MIRVGVLGAAQIAPAALYEPARETPGVEVLAVASRDPARARAQAATYGVPRVCDYETLLALSEIDAVYVPLPISLHHDWTLRALAAGKHVLCEKPFASNAAEARRMVAAADAAGRVCAEAFHWRYHPLAARIREVLAELGPVQEVEAGFTAEIDPSDAVRHSYRLSGGALMDLGCYAVQWARFVHGREPRVVSARMQEDEPRVDVAADVQLAFPDGARGRLRVDMRAGVPRRAWLRVRCAAGELEVDNPLAPHTGHELRWIREGVTTREEVPGRTTFHHQLEAFVAAITNREPLPTGGDDAIATLDVLDAAYRAAGLPLRGEAR